MKLSEYAKLKGISYKTAWRWYKDGKLDAEQMPSGTVIALLHNPNKKNARPFMRVFPRLKINPTWIHKRIGSRAFVQPARLSSALVVKEAGSRK
ncbi:MAG: hypothetical protein U0Y68_06085 [Blastocatellia bacterium]